MTDQSTLAHEAGHVVGGLLAGHRIETADGKGAEKERHDDVRLGGVARGDLFGHLVAVLMGPMAAGKQPPAWPPLHDLDGNDDEHVVLTLVSYLKLTKPEYMAAVALAAHWIDDPLVKSAIAKVPHALGQTGSLTDAQVRDVGAGPGRLARARRRPAAGGAVRHLAVKAAVSEVTDLGQFTAIAAAYTVDRLQDRIVPGAFEKTIVQWQASGKRIPLHWNHRGDAANVIGSIDPVATRELEQGLYVEGKLDLQDSEVARQAWRSMKTDAVSLSFGYVALKTRKRGGINDLLELDLFEVSIVPHPANPDTRVLSMKAAVAERRVPTDAALRAQATAFWI